MAKADPTLVRASLAEATARAGADVPNYKNLYASTTNISQGYLKQITDIMSLYKEKKNKERVAMNKQLEPFKKIADETLVSLFSLKEAFPEKIIDAYEARIQELQDEFELVNTLGDGDTTENRRARMKLMGELQKISNQTKELRETTMNLSDRVANNFLNTDASQMEILDDAKKILDFKNLGTSNVGVTYGKDGVIFNVDGREYTMNQLNEAFPAIDETVDAGYLSLTDATAKQAQFDATGENAQYNYKKDEQRGYFIGKIKTKDDFQQWLRRLDGTDVPSFKEALLDDVSIPVSILSSMFIDDEDTRLEIGEMLIAMDINGDGIITEEDGSSLTGVDMEMFETNMDALVNMITNVNNEAFDLQASTSLLADYYIGGARNINGNVTEVVGLDEQIYNKNYNAALEKKNNLNNRYNQGNDKKGSSVHNGYMYYDDQDNIINQVYNNEPITVKNSTDSNTFISNGDGTWTSTMGETITTLELLRDRLQMINRVKTHHNDKFNFDYSEPTYNQRNAFRADYSLNVVHNNQQQRLDKVFAGKLSNGDRIDVAQTAEYFNQHFKDTAQGIGTVVFYESGGVLHVKGKGLQPVAFSRDQGGLDDFIKLLNSQEFLDALAA